MLFNVNVAAVVALALAMSAYASPIEGPSLSRSNPAAAAAGGPVPRDLPPSPAPGSPGPSVRVNKSYDSSPSYIEGKSYDNHSRRNNIDDFKKNHADNVGGTRKRVDV